jgi:hypothetical protein
MSNVRILLAVALAVAVMATGARAADPERGLPPPANLSTLIDTIRTNRRALVAVNLNLNEQEAAQFWPLYDRYQQEIRPIGDRQVALIEDYIAHFRDLSNERALQLANDYLAIEADRIRVRREFIDQLAKVLPGRTVARFLQIENKMDAVLRFDLASTIPVVEENPEASR